MRRNRLESLPWLPYVAPMVVFLALTDIEGRVPLALYPYLYGLKVLLVSLALWVFRGVWREIQWETRVLPLAVAVEIMVFAGWIWLDKWIPYPHLGARTGLNPFTAIENSIGRAIFLGARFYGLVLMVPLMEELFWRSFLLRYLTIPEFKTLPLGAFSWTAFALVAGAFGLAHSEWLVAILTAISYGLLLRDAKFVGLHRRA